MRLDEHNVSGTEKSVECYIESKAERPFTVDIGLDEKTSDQHLSYTAPLEVDGKLIRSPLLGLIDGKKHVKARLLGADVGLTKTRPFLFGDTQFTGN